MTNDRLEIQGLTFLTWVISLARCVIRGRPRKGQAHGRPRGLALPAPHGESPSLVSLFGPLGDRAGDKASPGHGLQQPPPRRLPPRHRVSLLHISPGRVA